MERGKLREVGERVFIEFAGYDGTRRPLYLSGTVKNASKGLLDIYFDNDTTARNVGNYTDIVFDTLPEGGIDYFAEQKAKKAAFGL